MVKTRKKASTLMSLMKAPTKGMPSGTRALSRRSPKHAMSRALGSCTHTYIPMHREEREREREPRESRERGGERERAGRETHKRTTID